MVVCDLIPRDYRYVCDQILKLICDQSDCDEWRKVWRAEGYKQGHAEGLMEGKEIGNATGFITGIEVGYGQGMLDGLRRGNETGFQIGVQLGYDEGYWRAISHFMMLSLIFVCVVLLVLLVVFMRKQIQEYVRAVTTKLQITEPKSALKVQTLEADRAKEKEQMTDEKSSQSQQKLAVPTTWTVIFRMLKSMSKYY